MDDPDKFWLHVYLDIFKSYIELGVTLDNFEALEFCIPNMEKTSKENNSFVFPLNFQSKNPNDIVEIVMVHWK